MPASAKGQQPKLLDEVRQVLRVHTIQSTRSAPASIGPLWPNSEVAKALLGGAGLQRTLNERAAGDGGPTRASHLFR